MLRYERLERRVCPITVMATFSLLSDPSELLTLDLALDADALTLDLATQDGDESASLNIDLAAPEAIDEIMLDYTAEAGDLGGDLAILVDSVFAADLSHAGPDLSGPAAVADGADADIVFAYEDGLGGSPVVFDPFEPDAVEVISKRALLVESGPELVAGNTSPMAVEEPPSSLSEPPAASSSSTVSDTVSLGIRFDTPIWNQHTTTNPQTADVLPEGDLNGDGYLSANDAVRIVEQLPRSEQHAVGVYLNSIYSKVHGEFTYANRVDQQCELLSPSSD